MRIPLPLFALLLAGCQVQAQEPKAPGAYEEKISVAGVERDFRLTIPPQSDGKKALPLVVGLHGWTGSSRLFELQTGFPELAKKEGFVFVAANGLGSPQGWNAGWIDLSGKKQDDVAYVNGIIDRVMAESKIDPNRVYVCGHSNGGFMTYLVASQLSDRLAAVGIVAGAVGVAPKDGPAKTVPEPKSTLPSAIMIHGDADPMVAYINGAKATLSRVVSQSDAVAWFAKRAGITEPATPSKTDRTEVLDWKGNGREVRFVTVKGGNHDWFGGMTREGREAKSGFDCTQAIWDFFKSQTRKS